MADAVRPSRVACWLSSARSVAFAGEAAVTMRGTIAILGPLIPACPGSRDTGAALPQASTECPRLTATPLPAPQQDEGRHSYSGEAHGNGFVMQLLTWAAKARYL